MKTIRLGDYIDLLTDYHAGGSYKTLKEKTKILYTPDYAVFVRTLNFEQSKFDTDLIYCDKSSYDFLSYSHLKENDILINKIANPGSVYIMPKVDYLATCAMNLFLLRFKNINQRYIYYVMKNSESYIKKQAHGTATKTITKDDVRNLNFLIHGTKEEQNRVERILSNIDRKIEINNKLNKELERVAKTLYNYWFVQFDFPDGNKRPYKSSGGKMVYNEVLKREIPADWEVKLVRDLFSTYLGGTPSRNISRYWNNGDISWLSSGEIANFPIVTSAERITQEGLENSATYLLPKNTLMISITGNIRVSISAITACTNQSVVGIKRNSDFSNSYLYFYFRNYIPQFETLMTGAVQKHINKDIIDTTPFLLPKKSILSSYQEQIDPIIDQIIDNALENNTLLRLRDFLLPMLMNGQVSVKS